MGPEPQIVPSSAWPAPRTEPARWLMTVRRVRKRPRTIRLLRQAPAAAILQLDLEDPAALATAGSDRLLDPAPLHPQRHLTPAEQHYPRGLLASATGIAVHLHPVMHAATSRLHLTSQAQSGIARHHRSCSEPPHPM